MSLRRTGIAILLILYVLLGSVYSVVTPIMEASDELWHYPMVKYVADRGRLPVQEPGIETAWRQEGSQAPLYYIAAASLTRWIDTSDLERVRWLNPHADNGKITEDGNTNLIVHVPAWGRPGEASTVVPYAVGVRGRGWQGTELAVHLIRFLSVCMGTGTVLLGYLLVLEVWPERVRLALATAALTAFNPMFLFISGAVNNDNLAMLLCAAGIWLLVRLVKRHGAEVAGPQQVWWVDTVVLGVVLGAAVLTKTSAMGLFEMRGGAAVRPTYELGSPIFDRATIHLNRRYYKGDTFVIQADNNSTENCYIQSATLDGKPLNQPWFYHDQLVDGGTLVLEMGPEPKKTWGSNPDAVPPSASKRK